MLKMHSPVMRWPAATLVLVSALACGGGGDGGTPPVTVASVVITAPALAPSFQTLGRTLQFTAEARDAAGAVIPGAPITWSSSLTSVATVSAAGVLTVAGNGTTAVRAASGGVQSVAVNVSVTQLASQLTITPGVLAFGALGSTRQLMAAASDSGGAPVAGAGTPAFSRAGDGLTASVSAGGLVTALGVGISDTAVVTLDTMTRRIPITVTQVVASVTLTPSAAETLATTGRTRQYSAAAADSQANAMAATFSWLSTVPDVATVDGNGLVTAVTDGNTNVRASSGGVFGLSPLVVRRYALTFSLTPPTASITTPGGSTGLTASALDSVDTPLPISWVSRNTSVATVSPTTGTATTVTAAGNGSTYIVMSAGTRSDSTAVTVTGQASYPLVATVNIGDFFFRSAQNSTENAAVDTIGVGGTVTWNWTGVATHNVRSIGSPSFISSALANSGSFQRTFSTVGTYEYDCQVHAAMTGRIVVR
jgi:plastocyanin